MRLTTNFGLPVAEMADARRDYPVTVDAPRSDAIDDLLAPPFTVLATSTTNTNQNVTATTYAALPNTWDNGATLNVTLTRPAIVLASAAARLNVQNLAVSGNFYTALHMDGLPVTPNSDALLVKQWGPSPLTAYIHDSTTIPIVLAAGSHALTLLAMRTGTADYSYVNYATVRLTFVAYTP